MVVLLLLKYFRGFHGSWQIYGIHIDCHSNLFFYMLSILLVHFIVAINLKKKPHTRVYSMYSRNNSIKFKCKLKVFCFFALVFFGEMAKMCARSNFQIEKPFESIEGVVNERSSKRPFSKWKHRKL